MKPVYWIPLLALLGGIIGYAIFRATGWLGATTGVIIGILIGALVYSLGHAVQRGHDVVDHATCLRSRRRLGCSSGTPAGSSPLLWPAASCGIIGRSSDDRSEIRNVANW